MSELGEFFYQVVWPIILVLFLVGTPTLTAIYFIEQYECRSKTAHIGFAHDYGLIQGCLIETEKDKWVPLENWRQF